MKPVSRVSVAARQGSVNLFFFFKQKTAYEIKECDWFRRVLFRSSVEDGHAEDHDGHEEIDGVQVGKAVHIDLEAQHGEHKAQKERAGVAHEDARRVEVVVQEAQTRAHQGHGHGGDEYLL